MGVKTVLNIFSNFTEISAKMKRIIILIFNIAAFQFCFAQIPQDYYVNTEGKIKEELKTELHEIIKTGHTSNTYASLWVHFQKTDKHPAGFVWDMYSNCNFIFVTNQCGNYSSECDCYNREHSVPASWIGGEFYPMYADLHHLLPVDGWTNNKRGNYPFGKVGSASWTSLNGSKLGNSNYSGYSGVVFEPVDQYKGDFARIMFYMVTRYENLLSQWQVNDVNATAVLDGNIWPAFNQWAGDLYLQWHEQDPVDQKELMRNDSVFSIQNNRNPFIDHPEFARQIWGPDAGIQNNEISQISIFPQPASDDISISMDYAKADIFIFDFPGRLCYSSTISESPSSVQISHLSPGIYFLKLIADDIIVTHRIIKQ